MKNLASCLVCWCVFAAMAPLGVAQASAQTKEANLKAYVGMIRKDLKKDKVSILTELMSLSPEEAAKFWPVYGEYDKALTKLADERIALIRLYADNFSTLSEETATKIALGSLDIQARRLDLQKEYFQRLSKTLTPKAATRWLQVETQIEKLVDLQILASLPVVE
jgi:hypothetical protein